MFVVPLALKGEPFQRREGLGERVRPKEGVIRFVALCRDCFQGEAFET